MHVNVQVRRTYHDQDDPLTSKPVCFRHAVWLASTGVDISEEYDDFDSEYYLGDTQCRPCREDRESEDKRGKPRPR